MIRVNKVHKDFKAPKVLKVQVVNQALKAPKVNKAP